MYSDHWHFRSWDTAVDHFAAVHSQGDRDGDQGDVNDHTFSAIVGLGSLNLMTGWTIQLREVIVVVKPAGG